MAIIKTQMMMTVIIIELQAQNKKDSRLSGAVVINKIKVTQTTGYL
jgi:hypothetical protein